MGVLFCKGQSIDTVSVWRINSAIWEPGVESKVFHFKDFIDGDTTINSINYYKVYQTGYWYYSWPPYPNYFFFTHIFHGFLREENNKWYTSDGLDDLLLYDFTLDVNDTVISAFTFTSGDPIIVTVIDSVLIESEYKKRFHLNLEYGAEFIIEDIGASSGLFENMAFFEWDSELVCFAKNGESLWGIPTEECELNVSINEDKPIKSELLIFPNPASNYFYIKLPKGRSFNVKIFDSFGRLIFEKINTETEQLMFSVEKYSPGCYFLQIEDDSILIREKLIKI